MSKVQEHIQTAKAFIYGDAEDSSIKKAKVIFEKVRAEVKEVNEDLLLSGQGKAEKEREIRAQGAKELAQMVADYRKRVDRELDAAEKEARAIVAKPSDKPEQHVLDSFADEYQDAITRLTVFNTGDAARTLLRQMQSVTDPYIAKTIRDDFARVGASMRGHVDNFALQNAYGRISKIAETDARADAKQSLREIETLRGITPVNSMINIGIESALGSQHRSVLSDYQSYLD